MEEAVGFVAVVAVLAITDQKVVEFLRTLVTFSGNWTRLIAWVVGIALAFSFSLDPSAHIAALVGKDLRDFPDVVDWILAGAFIAAGAGYAADRAGRSTSTPGTIVVNNGGVAQHGAEAHTNE